MTSAKIVNIKSARQQARRKAPRSMEEIAERARREYERLKSVAETEPDNLVSGDPTKIHEEHDNETD
jgi:hypothetical protein